MTGYHLPFAVYLTFSGNCREAFRYYQHCFGGELSLQTMADTPHGMKMARGMQKAVICAILENEYLKLMGTDLTEEGSLVAGNNLSILIQCRSVNERAGLIIKLVGNQSRMSGSMDPLIGITDRYNVRWLLSVN